MKEKEKEGEWVDCSGAKQKGKCVIHMPYFSPNLKVQFNSEKGQQYSPALSF